MRRTRPAGFPAIALDRSSRQPLHGQLFDNLHEAILRGVLHGGSQLPSTRALSRALGVSRNTVLSVYEMLAAEGLVEAATGSGTRVRGGLTPSPRRPVDGLRELLRGSHYPFERRLLQDPDGNAVYVHR